MPRTPSLRQQPPQSRLRLGPLALAVLACAVGERVTAQAKTPKAVDHEALRKARLEDYATMARRSEGVLSMQQLSYASKADGLKIPVCVFAPGETKGDRAHPVLVWIHGGVHGRLTPNYWPYIRDAVARGYVVLCPEYRGSKGWGKAHYDAIDYGGMEVEDCTSAIDWARRELPFVDSARAALIGWSHGGFIATHAVTRETRVWKAAVAIVPVCNLVHRLGFKPARYDRGFTEQPRIGARPDQRTEVFLARSPLFQVDRLQTPIHVQIAKNDPIVPFHESEALVHALRIKKPDLAELRVYTRPRGAHHFNRRVLAHDPSKIDWTPESRDSWNRIWTFLEWHLRPYERGAQARPDSSSRRDQLMKLWDFQDPAKSAKRFEDLLQKVEGDLEYALTVRTQLARARGLERNFDAALRELAIVDRALAKEEAVPELRVRAWLERGRILNTRGDKLAARPFFEDAYSLAVRHELDALAIDAAHMVAIVEAPRAALLWHERARRLARRASDPRAKAWLGPVLNNLAWSRHDLGDYDEALSVFREALAFREAEGNPRTIQIARWSVARALRSLGRLDEALEIQRSLERGPKPSGYVLEELGELLLAKGDADAAKPYFRRAFAILSKDAWLQKTEAARLERLRKLGATIKDRD